MKKTVLANLGNGCLIVVMLLTVFSIVSCFTNNLRIARVSFLLANLLTISAFLALLYGFVTSNFSLQNVFLNSSSLKPLIYKISGSWASHEGSILLLLALMSIVNLFTLSDNKVIAYYQIFILSLILLAFSSFVYFTSSPFLSLSFSPEEGMGLNPMLQDTALAIHPPILYLGYVTYLAIFVLCCVLLFESGLKSEILTYLRNISYYGLIFLTSGIALGSWWAYRELGWGGFWFFDPVENISLIPWLCGIAFHHSLLVSLKYDKLNIWVITLGMLSFLLIVLGIFLVRSGVLSSVHAFASSPERGIYIFIILILLVIASLVILSAKIPNIQVSHSLTPSQFIILIGNVVWSTSLVVILVATIYPIVYQIVSNNSISVGYEYFIHSFLPILLPSLLLAGIYDIKSFKKNIIIIIFSIICTIVFSAILEITSLLSIFSIFCSLCLMSSTILEAIIKKVAFNSKLFLARIVGHFGFGLLAFSITLNSVMQSELEFVGTPGTEIGFKDMAVKLQNINYAKGANYLRQIAEFWLESKNGNITILKPENRLYLVENKLSQESDIYSYLFYDLYAVINKIEDNIVQARIYYRPWISFIWFSALLIVFGFLISYLEKKDE